MQIAQRQGVDEIRLSCADAVQVPVWLLKATRSILKSFQWARDAADRLVRAAHLCECCIAPLCGLHVCQGSRYLG